MSFYSFHHRIPWYHSRKKFSFFLYRFPSDSVTVSFLFTGWWKDHSLQMLNVSFLATTERLNQTILGINNIKMFVQWNDNLDLLYKMIRQSAGNELCQDNVRAFVDLIQGFKEPENNEVKVKWKNIVVVTPADILIQVIYKADF